MDLFLKFIEEGLVVKGGLIDLSYAPFKFINLNASYHFYFFYFEMRVNSIMLFLGTRTVFEEYLLTVFTILSTLDVQ